MTEGRSHEHLAVEKSPVNLLRRIIRISARGAIRKPISGQFQEMTDYADPVIDWIRDVQPRVCRHVPETSGGLQESLGEEDQKDQ